VSEEAGGGEQGGKGPLRRTLDLCVFAPVGAAMTLAEELPELIEKGRRRVELQLGNAHVVGRYVVRKGRRDLAGRIDDILANGVEAARAARMAEQPAESSDASADVGAGAGAGAGMPGVPSKPSVPDVPAVARASLAPTPAAAPDPASAATVQRALADYDTLSASQVVRRLESLGDDELRAVQRYEASHRNRRTILNRASQLLDSGAAGSSAG
jgi:hypothetical protein